jgi:hypothetical protein
VAAGVVEGADAIVIAHEHQRLRADAHGPPVAGAGELLLARDHHPAVVPERFQLALVVRRVVVPGGWQAGLELLKWFPCHPPRVKL